MKISHRQFMASQAGYGLMIAKNSELPALHDSNAKWDFALDRIAELSVIMADKQIKKTRDRNRRK